MAGTGEPEQDIDALFEQTLIGDYDDDAAWDSISALYRIGSQEVLERASAWCFSDDPLKRSRGASILAQLGKTVEHPTHKFPDECFLTISKLLPNEREARVLSSAISALSHTEKPEAIGLIVPYASHPDPDVRFHVACALGSFADDARAVESLVVLTRDNDSDVRDWATFGVGVLGDTDTLEVREALFERLSDCDEDASEEALVALCKRKDLRALPRLLSLLEKPNPSTQEYSTRVQEAADWLLDSNTSDEKLTAAQYVESLKVRFHVG